jgi:hypothetical protein
LKAKARLDVRVTTRHRQHPCCLTIQNQPFFSTPSLCREELCRP